jgi:hypothetical protein
VPRRHAYPDANSNGNSHGNGNPDCNHHANSHCDAASYADTKAHSGAKTAPYHCAASSLKPLDYQLYQHSNEN